jgi:hypothetical protein
MQLVIDRQGSIRCIYSEMIDLRQLGQLAIQRASHVEPDVEGQWWADLSLVAGPLLGPFVLRTQALAAELSWLSDHLSGLSLKGNENEVPRASLCAGSRRAGA